MFSQTLLPLLAAVPYVFGQNASSIPGISYGFTETGGRNTLDWRVHLKINNAPASFWHDVPLYPDPSNNTIVNYVVEIPRWEDAKIEIRRDEPMNPIFHDDNEDGVRFVESVWPHRSYPFLYGSIPQTWESPNFNHSFTGAPGDNDPVDAFDISQDIGYVGQIKQVKILGGLAVVDGDETDWKIMVIDIADPLAALVNNIDDLNEQRPGVAEAYRQWFRVYKIPRGDDLIPIVGDDYQNATFTAQVIEESHGYWQELIAGEVDSNEINFNQTSMASVSESYIEAGSAYEELEIPQFSTFGTPARKPEIFNHWYYVDGEEGTFET